MPSKIRHSTKHNTSTDQNTSHCFTYLLLCSCEGTVRCYGSVRSSVLLPWLYSPPLPPPHCLVCSMRTWILLGPRGRTAKHGTISSHTCTYSQRRARQPRLEVSLCCTLYQLMVNSTKILQSCSGYPCFSPHPFSLC